MRPFVILVGGWLCLLGWAVPADGQAAPRLYRYRDDSGKEVLVTGKASIPSRYLDRARPMGRGGGYGKLGPETNDVGGRVRAARAGERKHASIYRFHTPDGHVAYGDRPEAAPPGARVERIDLTQPDALAGRGAVIVREIAEHERRLAARPACRQARAMAKHGGWLALASRHPALLVIGGVLMALLAVTPWMVRKVDAARWWRTLLFSAQILGMLGWATFAIGEMRHSYRTLRQMTEPCLLAAQGEREGSGMEAVLRKLDRVQQLRAAMQELERHRARTHERDGLHAQ